MSVLGQEKVARRVRMRKEDLVSHSVGSSLSLTATWGAEQLDAGEQLGRHWPQGQTRGGLGAAVLGKRGENEVVRDRQRVFTVSRVDRASV